MNNYGSIVFYGERGVVNLITLELSKDIEKGKQFLSLIKFNEGYVPRWIQKVKSLYYFVELSFAEFGNPDLVILCEDTDNKKHLVFVEAKLVRYEDSAVNLRTAKRENGINSRINAQLTLKYRLSEALRLRLKGQDIEEDQNIHCLYAPLPTESARGRRRVKKQDILGLCDRYFSDVEDYLFVAMTDNDEKDEPFKDEELSPLIVDKLKKDLSPLCGKDFGIITYRSIRKIQGMPDINVGTSITGMIPESLRTVNWEKFSPFIKNKLRKQIQSLVNKSIGNIVSPDKACKEYSGSDSYTVAQRTIIKIIPLMDKNGQEESVLLAVLSGLVSAAGLSHKYFPDGSYKIGVCQDSCRI
jgi:hypothetical protein